MEDIYKVRNLDYCEDDIDNDWILYAVNDLPKELKEKVEKDDKKYIETTFKLNENGNLEYVPIVNLVKVDKADSKDLYKCKNLIIYIEE